VGIGARRLNTLKASKLDSFAEKCPDTLQRLGIRATCLTIEESHAIPDPPVVWYSRGTIPAFDEHAVAIVGARRATAYGLRIAARFAEELSVSGVWVVSGLARGIDAAAHRATVQASGKTLAVLGCGPDVVYPPEHAQLMEGILNSGGGILTEYPPGVPALAHHFPRRNRILVGFCQALVVVEARIKSGTLTSVRWALENGREVLAVPGPIDSQLSEGPVQLLREGAIPAGGIEDILQALGLESEAGTPPQVEAQDLSRSEQRLLAWIGTESLELDAHVSLSGDPPGNLLSLLIKHELKGNLERDSSGLGWRRAL
jgi:DNA processing protein